MRRVILKYRCFANHWDNALSLYIMCIDYPIILRTCKITAFKDTKEVAISTEDKLEENLKVKYDEPPRVFDLIATAENILKEEIAKTLGLNVEDIEFTESNFFDYYEMAKFVEIYETIKRGG